MSITNLEAKPDSRILNYLHMNPFDYEWLLNKFHPSFHEKLRVYTGQELFYCYMLCTFKPKNPKAVKHSEVFFLAMKAKQLAWLRETPSLEKYAARVDSATGQRIEDKIGARWNLHFEELIELEVA
jgi:hypothetical protein